MIALLPTLIFVGTLKAELPDNPDFLGGAEIGLRWNALPAAHLGGRIGWKGGVDDTNPERILISQRIEAVTQLGVHLDLDALSVRGDLLAGMSRVEGWPFGALSRRSQFSPTVGIELGAAIPVGTAWGHPLAIDLCIGDVFYRIGDEWTAAPMAGIGIAGTLTGHE